MANLHDFEVKTIDGKTQKLSDYAGKTLLVVNVASRCGLTPQYTALEALYQRFKGKNFAILGFPCNDFGAQEPGTETEIKDFCESKYNVTFPLFSKVHVKGPEQAPVYKYLTTQTTSPDGAGDIAWNFAKFLISPTGQPLARFSPQVTPDDPNLVTKLEQSLA